MQQHWRPTLGAWVESGGVRFRVWTPEADRVDVIFEPGGPPAAALEKFPDGTFGALVQEARAGNRYRYRIDGGDSFPDPASRFQPEGVHGPSEIVDARRFGWTDGRWTGLERRDLVLYELHVGTFTPEGTFQAASERLPYLARLGISAVELMPVADFPGSRNWGYDGVDLFAPARCYGTPDDFRRLVDTAHGLGLAVFLDVVYNHLGPEGNYLSAFSPFYFSEHQSPWGQALNLDGPKSSMVREFFIENALHWVHEYHLDGLRLDATHALVDDDPRPFVAQLAARVHESACRPISVIAEDHRNLAHMIRPEGEGGWGLDGVWADDFHHFVRATLAGDHEGYYRDYVATMPNLARTIDDGWYFRGEYSEHLQHARGTDPGDIAPRRFVFFIQNHDQVGNRAFGERLHHQIALASYRAASVLLLCAPETPLLFMGQEWAATTPFLYFTDHPEALGTLVTEGRRSEFKHFSAFSDPATRARIPDPQDEATFAASRLDWAEAAHDPHACTLRLYERLLALRRQDPAIRSERSAAFALAEGTLLLRRDAENGSSLLAIVQMTGASSVRLAPGDRTVAGLDLSRCEVLLTTEERMFAADSQPPVIDLTESELTIAFLRPSAVLLSVAPLHL